MSSCLEISLDLCSGFGIILLAIGFTCFLRRMSGLSGSPEDLFCKVCCLVWFFEQAVIRGFAISNLLALVGGAGLGSFFSLYGTPWIAPTKNNNNTYE